MHDIPCFFVQGFGCRRKLLGMLGSITWGIIRVHGVVMGAQLLLTGTLVHFMCGIVWMGLSFQGQLEVVTWGPLLIHPGRAMDRFY